LSLDSNLEVMFNLAKNILIFNRVDSVKEIYDQIDQITANDIQNPKPHPETFLKCAELMGVNPKECMVFEDGILGMKAAAEAGMLVVDVNDYFKMEFTV
jgi:HAD superfamily hydrolase (TIGR01509 family)